MLSRRVVTLIVVLVVASAAAVSVLVWRSRPAPEQAPAARPRFSVEDIGASLPRSGQWRQGFALADLDGDGHLDLIHGPPRKGGGAPWVFLGSARGWSRWTAATFAPQPYDYGDVAIADFNGDGIPDVALAMHLRGLLVLTGDGRGGYAPWSQGLALGAGAFSSRALAAADWDRDGRPDLVALSDGPRPFTRDVDGRALGLRIFLNRGGTWEQVDADNPANTGFGDALAVGDVDGDGHTDALAASGVVGSRHLLHRGRGQGREVTEVAPLPPQALVRAFALADFDDDGRLDPVLATRHPGAQGWTAGIELLLHRDSVLEAHAVFESAAQQEIVALATGDLDGDGHRDLGGLRDDGALLLFAGDGKGAVVQDLELAAPKWRAGCRGSRLQFADLDRDGRDEIVASFGDEPDTEDDARRCPSGGDLAAWRATSGPASRPRRADLTRFITSQGQRP